MESTVECNLAGNNNLSAPKIALGDKACFSTKKQGISAECPKIKSRQVMRVVLENIQ
jgi:hypothetical protein